MPSIVIHQFEKEQDAKDFFGTIVDSSELKGCFFKASGKLFLNVDGVETAVDTKKKFYVFSSGSDVVADIGA